MKAAQGKCTDALSYANSGHFTKLFFSFFIFKHHLVYQVVYQELILLIQNKHCSCSVTYSNTIISKNKGSISARLQRQQQMRDVCAQKHPIMQEIGFSCVGSEFILQNNPRCCKSKRLVMHKRNSLHKARVTKINCKTEERSNTGNV